MRPNDPSTLMRTSLIVLALLLAGCNAPADEPAPQGATPTPTGTPTAATPPITVGTPTPALPAGPTFPLGIIYRDPTTSRLAHVAGDAPAFALTPGGFDVEERILVQGDNRDGVRIIRGDGTERRLPIEGLDHIGRASLSPDGTRVVVQATEGAVGAPPWDFNVFVVDLATGAHRRISAGTQPDEAPEWSPSGDLIAYSSFSPTEGVNLHVATPEGEERLILPDAGAIHLAFSPDGGLVLDPGRLRIVNVTTAELVADLRDEAIAGLRAAGYDLDERYPGQANRGTFPLDGDFSPDGTQLVFDGAVVKDGQQGVAIMTMGVDGGGFRVVAGPFAVNPATTNGLNYSEVNPMWR